MNELGPILIVFRLALGASPPDAAVLSVAPVSAVEQVAEVRIAKEFAHARGGPPKSNSAPRPGHVHSRSSRPDEDRWFAEDKARHFFMSFATTQLAFGAARAVGIEHRPALTLGIAAGGAAGLWKEFRDRRLGRPFSTRDLVWDAAGVAAGAAVMQQTSHDD